MEEKIIKRHYNCIVVISNEKNKLLFCKRVKDPYKGKLNFVGGKVENNENGFQAAYRELFEETGIGHNIISISRIMDIVYYDEEFVLEIYAGILEEEKELHPEINPLLWMAINEDFNDKIRFAGDQNIAHIVNVVRKHFKC